MEIVGTKAAFMTLISQRGFAAKHGINKTTVSQWNSGDRVPTIDKMEEILKEAGATLVQESIWDLDGLYVSNMRVDLGHILEDYIQGKWIVITGINPDIKGEIKGKGISQIYNENEKGITIDYIVESAEFPYPLDLLVPIIISEDWLFRFGFRKTEFMIGKGIKYWIYQKGNFACILPSNGVLREINGDDIVNYLHELQELYFEKTNSKLLFLS